MLLGENGHRRSEGSLVSYPWSKTEKLNTKKKRKITVSEQEVRFFWRAEGFSWSLELKIFLSL